MIVHLQGITAGDSKIGDVLIRSARREERAVVTNFVRSEFGERWVPAVTNGFDQDTIPIFIAIDHQIQGFACYDGVRMKTGVFGSMGTALNCREKGIRKRHFVDGWSIREISRRCGIARQTVRKMLEDADVPHYRLTKPRPRPVMERWLPVIEAWLREDELPGVPRKQRHTSARIHERLKEEYPLEFDAAESTVRHWVARLRNKKQEAFIPLTADAGELAEADFGRVVMKLNGKLTELSMFVMRLRYSGVTFAHAFNTEKLEAFLEGHRLAFEWFGGVPGDVRYDNPKTAVTKILAGTLREEHELLSSLRAHYLFDSDFCRPGETHEKGGVEHCVGYVGTAERQLNCHFVIPYIFREQRTVLATKKEP